MENSLEKTAIFLETGQKNEKNSKNTIYLDNWTLFSPLHDEKQ